MKQFLFILITFLFLVFVGCDKELVQEEEQTVDLQEQVDTPSATTRGNDNDDDDGGDDDDDGGDDDDDDGGDDDDDDGGDDDDDDGQSCRAERNIANFDRANCRCELGYYAVTRRRGGRTVITGCEECPPGTYCPDGINSMPCAAGSFSALSRQIACEPCSAGTFNPVEGAIQCIACPPGQFQSARGAIQCATCPIGTYQGDEGSIECLNCNTNTIEGSATCDEGNVWQATRVSGTACFYDIMIQLSTDFSTGTVTNQDHNADPLTLISQSGNTYTYSIVNEPLFGPNGTCTVTIVLLSDGSITYAEDCPPYYQLQCTLLLN